MNEYGTRRDELDQRKMEEDTVRRMDGIRDPGKRYALKDCIGFGVYGDVYEAVDQQAGNRKVAVKIQRLTSETQLSIVDEYRVLRDLAGHPNIPEFYGIYRRRSARREEHDQMWFVMELCEGGPVDDLVRGLIESDRRMREEHIAYVLKEVVKALIHLHENNVMHRDVRASNIVLTKEGEVKLVDFGLSRTIRNEAGDRRTSVGSPCWMAPEIVVVGASGYDARSDVWAVGITAIELADGKPPFQDMHPTRALFQIVRNPPPGLYRPANWSQNFNDFIAECLEKNPDNRPFMVEIGQHPFLTELPENDYTLTQEIKALVMSASEAGRDGRKPEAIVREGFLKTLQTEPAEAMLTEDLAALENLTEETILNELYDRLKRGHFQTFVGDVLLVLNPNETLDEYGPHFHSKYRCKSRSDNAPHIYAVADSAYQDVLHHEEPQHILFAGESNSGKTTNMLHAIEHLMYLGKGLHDTGKKVQSALKVIRAFSHAATPLNSNSTRCVLQTGTTFGSTGKASGAIFWLYLLEKWRISTRDKSQSNFHVLYYFYDGLEASGKLRQYSLKPGRKYRYLRISDRDTGNRRSIRIKSDPRGNAVKFNELNDDLKVLEMEEHADTMWRILAAILILGETRFEDGTNGEAEIENTDVVNKVADLLGVDSKKLVWSMINYCLIKKGSAVRRRHTCDEAKEARNVLANTIYQRLVDWIVNSINQKLSIVRTLFGDRFCISVLDLFGFECFAVNRLQQLVVNAVNEQLQCHYNQRVFAWEMQEQEEEEIPVQRLRFYDNRDAINRLMDRNYGVFHVIDDASRHLRDARYILEKIGQYARGSHVKVVGSHEFTIAHYTGKLTYDVTEMSEKNRDFLPPEVIETMRLSKDELVKQLFANQLTKSGSLTAAASDHSQPVGKRTTKGKWGAALMQEAGQLRRYNTASRGQFSQTRKMRTCACIFRATSLEILRNLSIGSGGVHFVRCVRTSLDDSPRGFHRDLARQQIRALAILDTAKARQNGYPCRIPFQEFLRRYKFLAFDFDENVEMTRDNCRLLLVRLKMEGWMIGKTKVFLKYYNEEYLSRLYETQVKKIVKVQCMLRAFLARKNVKLKIDKVKEEECAKKASIKEKDAATLTPEEAAVKIQKVYRGHVTRKQMGGQLPKGERLDRETKDFLRFYGSKWRSKSVFQVLLHYRAARYQDLVQFSQQVHLFNQSAAAAVEATNAAERGVPLEKIDPKIKASTHFGSEKPPQVHKLPFYMNREFPFFDTSYMNDPTKLPGAAGSHSSSASDDEHEAWDAPLRRATVPWATGSVHTRDAGVQTTDSPRRAANASTTTDQSLIHTPFSRDPNVPVQCPPKEEEEEEEEETTSDARKKCSNLRPARTNNYADTGSIRSRKKVPPPPVPTGRPSQMRNNTRDGNYSDREYENGHKSRVNPIREMQMIARQNESEENGPFNFQGMLRKTRYNRASMKRTTVYNDFAPSPPPISNVRLASRANPYDSNVVYRSSSSTSTSTGASRRDSPEWSPNEMIRMSERYGKEGKGASGVNESVSTEIAPGIVVKGYVAEL